ncbi:MAG: hypothetical protein R2701_04535 [Acidimicrobiales bacterium]
MLDLGGALDRAGQGAPPDLLVELRELASDGHPTIQPAGTGQVGQGSGQPVGRLEQHAGPPLDGHGGDPLDAMRALARQESSNANRPVGSLLATSPASGGGRPGHHLDHPACCRHRGHQPLARVRHPRHPGVGDHRDHLARSHPADHLGDDVGLGVLVGDAQRAGAHPRVLEEPAGAARVLAAHKIGGGEDVDGAGRKVAEVADRRADQHQATGTAGPDRVRR